MAEKTQTRRGPLGWVKRHKKLTIFLVIVLVAALVLVNVLGKTDKAAAGNYQFVRTTVLTKTTLSDTVSVTGTVKAGSSASVTASDSVKTYNVTAVNVAVGDTVRKGDVIATLDTTDVEKQIANAQLQLSDTRTDARKNYTQAVEDQTTNLATAQEISIRRRRTTTRWALMTTIPRWRPPPTAARRTVRSSPTGTPATPRRSPGTRTPLPT